MSAPCWLSRSLVVWTLCVPAFIVPRCLLKTSHNPPVGFYIAIMGVLAVGVTLVKDPQPIEKAAWVALIALFMYAEITNLYTSDAIQVAKFAQISADLEATKQGLDSTATGIGTTADTLKSSIAANQQQFIATMERSDKIFQGVQENLNYVTGGDGYIAFFVSPNMGAGDPPTYPLFISVDGKYPMRSVVAQIQKLESPQEVQKQIASMRILQIGNETVLPGSHLTAERLGIGSYIITVWCVAGMSNQELELKLNEHGELDQSYKVMKDGRVRAEIVHGLPPAKKEKP